MTTRGNKPVLRAIALLLLLGLVFACAAYYSGATQWASDRWYGYWNTPYAEAPVPTPYAAYPTPPQSAEPAPYPAPAATAPPDDVPPPSDVPPEDLAQDDGPPPDEGVAETPYQPEDGEAPVDVAPVDRGGPPLSLHISIGDRGAGSVDCVPAYTVINDTHRPILLTQRAHYRGYGRGHRDK